MTEQGTLPQRSTLPAFQLALYGIPDQVGSLLAIGQNGIDSSQRACREPCRGLFVVDLFSAHS